MTIEEVMRVVGQYGDAVLEGPALPQIEAIHAALLALVAQARDDEAEECAGIAKAYEEAALNLLKPDGAMSTRATASAIRARIAARKGE